MLKDHKDEIEKMLRDGKTQAAAARRFGVTDSGMSRFVTGKKGKKGKKGANVRPGARIDECLQRFFDQVEPLLREMLFEELQRKLGESESP